MSLTTISYISLAASLIVRIANKFGFVHKIIFLCNCSILYTECLPLLKSKNTVLDVRNVSFIVLMPGSVTLTAVMKRTRLHTAPRLDVGG